MIRTVIFDIGGTLLGSPDFFMETTGQFQKFVVNKNNLYDSIKNNFMKRYRNMASDEMTFVSIVDTMCKTLADIFPEMKYNDIKEYSKQVQYATFLNKAFLYDDSIDILEYLLNRKATILVASDADSELLHLEFQKFNLTKYFDKYFISEEIEAYKPSWRFVERIKSALSDSPNEVIFVGDSDVDICMGKRLGVYTVLKNESKPNDINPDYVISNLKQLKDIIEELEK
jgi:HAD superfamily hydrolase (TIGR01549 family)